jgi:ABC-type amino acid transport substrate-binding protein
MKRFICCTVFAALAFAGPSAFAADDCTKITATGHPEYPVIAFKEGDNIAGAAPDLVAAIAKKLNVPLQSRRLSRLRPARLYV